MHLEVGAHSMAVNKLKLVQGPNEIVQRLGSVKNPFLNFAREVVKVWYCTRREQGLTSWRAPPAPSIVSKQATTITRQD